jgi:hypothetical protein
MSDELTKRSLGQRGIDTNLERDLVNYDPSFEYEKPRQFDEDQQYSTGEYCPSDNLVYASFYTVAYANKRIDEARKSINECSSIIEARLQNSSVPIEDSDIGKIIKGYLGSDQISFSDFKKACVGNSQEEAMVVSYYIEKEASIEAMLYPDVVGMSSMLDGCDQLIAASSSSLVDFGLSIDIEKESNEFINNWQELDERRNRLENELEAAQAAENRDVDLENELEIELEDIAGQIATKESNFSPTFNNLVAHRAQGVKSNSDRINETLNALPTDILGDSINEIIATLWESFDSETMGEWYSLISEIKGVLGSIRKVLILQDVMSVAKIVGINDIAMMFAAPIIRQVTDTLLEYIDKMRRQMIKPLLDFLYQVQKKCKKKSITVDHLAHTILDVSENIEDKLTNVILDYYRTTQKALDKAEEKMVHVKKTQWIKTFTELLDQFEAELDSISPRSVYDRVDGIDGIAIAKNVERRFLDYQKSKQT